MVMAEMLLAALITVVVAMLAWGIILVTGRPLVRFLRLPTDLPDGCRFEPPPPPPEASAGARERAEIWNQRADLCRQAHEVQILAWRASEHIAPDHAQRQQLDHLAQQACTSMADEDLTAAQASVASTLTEARQVWAEVEASIPAAPAPNHRRLMILFIILIVMCAWVLVGLPWLRGQLGGAG